MLFRAGHADVAEAAFLLDFARVAALQRAHVGQQSLLHADHEDGRELQPLGSMESDERDRVDFLVVGIDVGNQGSILEKRGEAVL